MSALHLVMSGFVPLIGGLLIIPDIYGEVKLAMLFAQLGTIYPGFVLYVNFQNILKKIGVQE